LLADPTAQVDLNLKLVADDPTSKLKPANINLAGRYFQIEEMEDSETRTTGMVLEQNGTITTLISDIPCFKEAFGTWEQTEDGQLQMNMARTFKAGTKKVLETDMGEFEFVMERMYTAELIYVGESVGADGVIHLLHEKWGDEKVGFFSMIDTETNPDDGTFDPSEGFSLLSTGR
jgi:hypothetical protein